MNKWNTGLPSTNDYFLVAVLLDNGPYISIWKWSLQENSWESVPGYNKWIWFYGPSGIEKVQPDTITHWMPLPQPPE